MADISKTKKHKIDKEVMRERLTELAGEMKNKFGIKSSWDGDNCILKGSTLKSGMLSLDNDSISIELTLGFMAKMIKGQIEKEIDSKIEKLVAP